MSQEFIPAAAPVHRRRLSRFAIALAARRNVLEIIPAISYRQPIVTGETLRRWHMLADPAGYKRVMLDNVANYPKTDMEKRFFSASSNDFTRNTPFEPAPVTATRMSLPRLLTKTPTRAKRDA